MSEYLKSLKTNPKNPRTITKQAFEELKDKLRRVPQGLDANKIVFKDGVIMAGNQRFKALQELAKEGFTVKDDYFVDATNWTDEQIREYVITSNVSDGEWDWDILANEWDIDDLNRWGVKNVKNFVQSEREVGDKSPQIVTSFITFEYNDEIALGISYELAGKLMQEMLDYKAENGDYEGFWDERLK